MNKTELRNSIIEYINAQVLEEKIWNVIEPMLDEKVKYFHTKKVDFRPHKDYNAKNVFLPVRPTYYMEDGKIIISSSVSSFGLCPESFCLRLTLDELFTDSEVLCQLWQKENEEKSLKAVLMNDIDKTIEGENNEKI